MQVSEYAWAGTAMSQSSDPSSPTTRTTRAVRLPNRITIEPLSNSGTHPSIRAPGRSIAGEPSSRGCRVPSRDMGRRERARLRAWAEELIARHGIDVARIVDLDPPLPEVDLTVVPHG